MYGHSQQFFGASMAATSTQRGGFVTDHDGMLREPLVPEAVRNLNLRYFDGRNLDAGHLDGGRDGVCGDCNHAGNQADCHDEHNNFFHVVTSISFVHFLPIKADSDLNYLLILQNHRVRCSCHPRIILKPLIQAMH